jgi:hypothetical protein
MKRDTHIHHHSTDHRARSITGDDAKNFASHVTTTINTTHCATSTARKILPRSDDVRRA